MNDSELIIVETPSGYKAYLKPKLTYAEVKQLKRASTSRIEYDTKNKTKVVIDGSAIIDGQEEAMKLFLVKLVDPQGNIIENPSTAIDTLEGDDGLVIEEKVTELTEKLELDKKKATT